MRKIWFQIILIWLFFVLLKIDIVYACSPIMSWNSDCVKDQDCTTTTPDGYSCNGKLSGYCDVGGNCSCICPSGSDSTPIPTPQARICGYVRDSNNVPVANATIRVAVNNEQNYQLVTTDANGYFQRSDLINHGSGYAVRREISPPGYTGLMTTSGVGWNWNYCVNGTPGTQPWGDTPVGSSGYECQSLGSGVSCADSANGQACRCNFVIPAFTCQINANPICSVANNGVASMNVDWNVSNINFNLGNNSTTQGRVIVRIENVTDVNSWFYEPTDIIWSTRLPEFIDFFPTLNPANASWVWTAGKILPNTNYIVRVAVNKPNEVQGANNEVCTTQPRTVNCGGYCGDGIRNGNEACDLGANNGVCNYGQTGCCSTSCALFDGPYCGDGIRNGNEACDLGANNGVCNYGQTGCCSTSCTLYDGPSCGDGIVNGNEQCDDRNTENYDQCSNGCRFVCYPENGSWTGAISCNDNTNLTSSLEWQLRPSCTQERNCEYVCNIEDGWWYNPTQEACNLCEPPRGITFSNSSTVYPFNNPERYQFKISTHTSIMNNGTVCALDYKNDQVYLWLASDPEGLIEISDRYKFEYNEDNFKYSDYELAEPLMFSSQSAWSDLLASNNSGLQEGDEFYLCTRTCNNDPEAEDGSGVNFGEEIVCSTNYCEGGSLERKPWFTVDGGLVGNEEGQIRQNNIPDEESFFGNSLPNGVISGMFNMNDNREGSNYFWARTSPGGGVRYDFDYWSNKLGLDSINNTGWTGGWIRRVGVIGEMVENSGMTMNQTSVIMIDGDLNITGNIEVNDNIGFMVIVNGDIEIAGEVTKVEGFYIADGEIIINDGNNNTEEGQIELNGGFVGYNGVNLYRNLGIGNEVAAEAFSYRPDIIKALEKTIPQLTIFRYNWREANPENN